jgi:competence ComEA-like helix-hairpin-helix protein
MINLKGFIVACAFGFICVAVPVKAGQDMVVENNVVEKIVSDGSVNINTATAELLALELKGVGIKRAQAIVDYRSEYGPFQSAEQLQDIKGIGGVLVTQNIDKIRL